MNLLRVEARVPGYNAVSARFPVVLHRQRGLDCGRSHVDGKKSVFRVKAFVMQGVFFRNGINASGKIFGSGNEHGQPFRRHYFAAGEYLFTARRNIFRNISRKSSRTTAQHENRAFPAFSAASARSVNQKAARLLQGVSDRHSRAGRPDLRPEKTVPGESLPRIRIFVPEFLSTQFS